MGLGYDLRAVFGHNFFMKDEAIENIFELIEELIAVAARQNLIEFLARRTDIIEAILDDSDEIVKEFIDKDLDRDCEVSWSLNNSRKRPVVQNLEDQFSELINYDRVMLASLKPINVLAKGKGTTIIQSKFLVDEKKTSLQQVSSKECFGRKIGVDDTKRKIDGRRQLYKESGSTEVKFEATKREFEGTSLHIQKVKRSTQFVDFAKLPQSKLVDC